MTDSSELSTAEISGFVTSKLEDIERDLEEKDYKIEELNQLIEAEKNGKNRKTVLRKLKKKRKHWKIDKDLEVAEEEIEGLRDILEDLEEKEQIDTGERDRRDIGETELIEILGATVKELRKFVKEEEINIKGLERILEGEKKVKDRKSAKKFLERKIKERKIEKDAQETEKDIEKLEKDLESIRDDEETSETVLEETEEISEEEEKEKDRSQEDKEEKKEGSQDSGEEKEEDEDKKDKDSEDEGLEEKKELVEGLDTDFGDEELKALSLDDLKELVKEEKRREELISSLKDEGLDEDDLSNATNSDLEKLFSQVKDESESSEESEDSGDEDVKSKEEIREEAEEDLEMLMGAGKGTEESDDDDLDRREAAEEKIKDLRENLKNSISREDEEDKSEAAFSGEKVVDKLESYEGLDDREAAVKTAHILKAYLEFSLGIDKEMTYDELADELPVEEYNDMDELADFFNQMQRDEYTKNIHIENMDEFIETVKSVIEELER